MKDSLLQQEMAEAVIRRIRRKCHAIERAIQQGAAGQREVQAIDSAIANLRRIENSLSLGVFRNLVQSLTDLRSSIIAAAPNSAAAFAAQRVRSGKLCYTKCELEAMMNDFGLD